MSWIRSHVGLVALALAVVAVIVLRATGSLEVRWQGFGAARDSVRSDRHGEAGSADQHESEHDEHAGEVALSPEAIAGNGIVIEIARKHELVPSFRVPAQVAFNNEATAHVGCPVRGRVADLRVRLGDEVERGQVLVVIESPELGEAQSELLQRRGAARAAIPAVELARNAYERGKTLFEQSKGIPLGDVQKRESEYRAAEATLLAAQAAEQAAENRLHLLGMSPEEIERLCSSGTIDPRYTVRAAIAGQVVQREVTLGELVGPEREALLVLAEMSKLWVLADVPEARLRETSIGARARVLLGREEDHWCAGTVTYLSPTVNPATRSVQVRIEATDRHAELRPGVFALVEIEAAGPEPIASVLAVPESAVQTMGASAVLFVPVPDEPGRFLRRRLRVGRAVGGMVPVQSGLAEGEPYVSKGSFLFKAELGKSSAEHAH